MTNAILYIYNLKVSFIFNSYSRVNSRVWIGRYSVSINTKRGHIFEGGGVLRTSIVFILILVLSRFKLLATSRTLYNVLFLPWKWNWMNNFFFRFFHWIRIKWKDLIYFQIFAPPPVNLIMRPAARFTRSAIVTEYRNQK